jgi:hypothetical protein
MVAPIQLGGRPRGLLVPGTEAGDFDSVDTVALGHVLADHIQTRHPERSEGPSLQARNRTHGPGTPGKGPSLRSG